MAKLGNRVFFSYRGYYYSQAKAAAQRLLDNRYCDEVVLYPPNSLSSAGELLLPYEYVELMEFILDRMSRSDAFVFLDSIDNEGNHDYTNSYFTQAELLQWQRFKDNPVVYPVDGGAQGLPGRGVQLDPLTKNQKKLWAKLSVGIARSYQHHMNPPFATGKYAKNCFMIPCQRLTCGEHFLASQKAVYSTLKGQFQIVCPHCGNGQFYFREEAQKGNFYRKPVILEQPNKGDIRILQSEEIISLILDNKLPDSFKTPITLPGEKLSSDLAKIGKVYAGLGVLAAGAIGLAALLSRDEESE